MNLLKLALSMAYKPLRDWLNNRALVLPESKRDAIAVKVGVSPLVVALVETEIRKQALEALDKEAGKIK